jgi:hypothetical protein
MHGGATPADGSDVSERKTEVECSSIKKADLVHGRSGSFRETVSVKMKKMKMMKVHQ